MQVQHTAASINFNRPQSMRILNLFYPYGCTLLRRQDFNIGACSYNIAIKHQKRAINQVCSHKYGIPGTRGTVCSR